MTDPSSSKERVSELISYWESCDPGDETFIREDILRDTIALLKSESVPSMGNAALSQAAYEQAISRRATDEPTPGQPAELPECVYRTHVPDGVPWDQLSETAREGWRNWTRRFVRPAARPAEPPPAVDVAPIAKLTVRDGLVQRAGLYAPGLPDGDHDVFPVPLSPKGELRPHVLAEPPNAVDSCADPEAPCASHMALQQAEAVLRICARYLANRNAGNPHGFNAACLAIERYFEVQAVGDLARDAETKDAPRLCPHGMPLEENICGPCSQGRPNRRADVIDITCDEDDERVIESVFVLDDICVKGQSVTKDAPPPPPQPPPKRVIGEYAPGFRPRDADEPGEAQSLRDGAAQPPATLPQVENELFVQARDLLCKIAGETDAARMEVNAWEAMELSRKMRAAEPPADARWKFIQDESLHLVPFAMPTGAGDADIGWRVLQSHMGKGDVVIAEVYRDRPAEAIDAARAALTKDAGECGACDKPGEHCANVHGICSRHGGRAHETSEG